MIILEIPSDGVTQNIICNRVVGPIYNPANIIYNEKNGIDGKIDYWKSNRKVRMEGRVDGDKKSWEIDLKGGNEFSDTYFNVLASYSIAKIGNSEVLEDRSQRPSKDEREELERGKNFVDTALQIKKTECITSAKHPEPTLEEALNNLPVKSDKMEELHEEFLNLEDYAHKFDLQ